jgi:hypothetical protein
MAAMERLGVDEYYQTISTWMKIRDEQIRATEKLRNSDGDSGTRFTS